MKLPVTHDECFAALGIAEGDKLDLSPNDRGNWTGGAVGVGKLTGSRFGLSSMTYPLLDKETLTAAGAEAIYLADFWIKYRIADLPPQVRFLVYSCDVNSGPGNGARWLQTAIGVQGIACGGVDGSIGDRTVAGAAKADPHLLAREISAQRLFTVSSAAIFAQDRLGLSRRIINDAAVAEGSIA
jgi:lysozyme family protein